MQRTTKLTFATMDEATENGKNPIVCDKNITLAYSKFWRAFYNAGFTCYQIKGSVDRYIAAKDLMAAVKIAKNLNILKKNAKV